MVRAYVVHLVSKAGERGSVTFDRYGQNADVFNGRTDDQALNQAVSNALAAALRKYGPGGLESYNVYTVE